MSIPDFQVDLTYEIKIGSNTTPKTLNSLNQTGVSFVFDLIV